MDVDLRRRSSIVKTSAFGVSTPSKSSFIGDSSSEFQFLNQSANDSSSDHFIDAMDDSRVHQLFEYVFSKGALLTMIRQKTNSYIPVVVNIKGLSINIEKVGDDKLQEKKSLQGDREHTGNAAIDDNTEHDKDDNNTMSNISVMKVFSKFSPVRLFAGKKRVEESEMKKSDVNHAHRLSRETIDIDEKRGKYPNTDLDQVKSIIINVQNITNLLWNHVIFTIDFNPGPIGLETEVRSNKLVCTNILKKSQADTYRDILLNSQVIYVRDVYITTLSSFKDEVLKNQFLPAIRVKFIVRKEHINIYEMKKNNTEYYESDAMNKITIVFKEFNNKRDPTLLTGHNYIEIGCNSIEERDSISVGVARLITDSASSVSTN